MSQRKRRSRSRDRSRRRSTSTRTTDTAEEQSAPSTLARSTRRWAEERRLPHWAADALTQQLHRQADTFNERPTLHKMRMGDDAFPIYARMRPVTINICNQNIANVTTNVRQGGKKTVQRRRSTPHASTPSVDSGSERERSPRRHGKASKRRTSSPSSRSSSSRSRSSRSRRRDSDGRQRQSEPETPVAIEEPVTPSMVTAVLERDPTPVIQLVGNPWAPMTQLSANAGAFDQETSRTRTAETLALLNAAPNDDSEHRHEVHAIVRQPHVHLSSRSTRQDFSVRTGRSHRSRSIDTFQ